MSACDSCRKPGQCCELFHLTFSQEWHEYARHNRLYGLVAAAINWLPFVPKAVDDRGETWWGCPLVEDGRCTDYPNRPQLCRDYQAGEDALCAEFIGPAYAAPVFEVDYRGR